MADSPEPTLPPETAQPDTTRPGVDEILRSVQHLEPHDRLRLIVQLWASLPADYWAAPTAQQRNDIMSRLSPATSQSIFDVPWRIIDRVLEQHRRASGSKIYSAPRRFDLATIFVVTTAYCLLFALLSATTWPSIVSVLIAGFITLVGLGQALLYGGRRPRKASIVVGIALFCLGTFWSLLNYPNIILMGGRPTRTPLFALSPMIVVNGLVYSVIAGSICGYLAGTVVGGVFLVIDRIRQRFSHPPDSQSDLPTSMEAAPASPEAG